MAIAYATLPSPYWVGLITAASDVGRSGEQLTATSQRWAWMFRAPKAGIIHKVHVYFGVCSGPQDLKVSFQDVSAGFPDGTIDQFRIIPSASVVTHTGLRTGIMSSDGTDTGSLRTVARRDHVAVVIQLDSAAGNVFIGAPSSIGITSGFDGADDYIAEYNGAAWSKISGATGQAGLAVEYTDGTYCVIGNATPFSVNATRQNLYTTATPDEAGVKFTAEFNSKLGAVCIYAASWFAGLIKLYDSANTVIDTIAVTANYTETAAAVKRLFWFANDNVLTAGQVYRLTVQSTGTVATDEIALLYGDVLAAELLDAFNGGQGMHWTSRSDAGAWSDVVTRKPFIILGLTALQSA